MPGLYKPEYEHDACGVGFIANIAGKRSHDIIRKGLEILTNMKHRGSAGSDPKTGDGAGITIQIPDRYFQHTYNLPIWGNYGTGLMFLPKQPELIEACKSKFEAIVHEEGHSFLFWREVPVNAMAIGHVAKASEPFILQPFIAKKGDIGRRSFERQLFIIRKLMEKWAREQSELAHSFHVCSLSNYKIIYKGLVLPERLSDYFLDLKNPDIKSALALVHSRFSTNTFPTWDLAQPFRFIAHNGEINTVRGNRVWWASREALLESPLLGDDLRRIVPILDPDASDSLSFDNVLELLVMSGRSIPEAMLMLVPEAWDDTNPLPRLLKACFEYHATFLEPWGGPANVCFTDGQVIGANLDRNGLRPARYVITNKGYFILASEAGVQHIPAKDIQSKGRLKAGKMIVVDTEEGRVLTNDEVKLGIAAEQPYRKWLSQYLTPIEDLDASAAPKPPTEKRLTELHNAFGYNIEELKVSIASMCLHGKEPVGSMGNDTPMAVLSHHPQRLFNYFKQLFAQVTNPALDSLRESVNMNLKTYIGQRENLLSQSGQACRSVRITRAMITHEEAAALKNSDEFLHAVIPMVFDPNAENGLEEGIVQLCQNTANALLEGAEMVFLSDRDIAPDKAAIPSLLAVSSLHHYLVNSGKRMLTDIFIETGEVREPMHVALLYGYGADMVYPYLLFDTIPYMKKRMDILDDITLEEAQENLRKAFDAGLLKIMSKMGIPTLRSYRGSQLFEAIGISDACINAYFPGTASRIGGLRLQDIADEALLFHKQAFSNPQSVVDQKPAGTMKFRRGGEFHGWNPKVVVALQKAVRNNDYEAFKAYADLSDSENKEFGTLRGLLTFTKQKAIPLDQVESETSIMKRFTTGAMSFGALSKEAHEALAIAMNSIGGRSNSGEGGEDPERFSTRQDGTLARSAIKQIASGRFGVTAHYLVNADELQIKIAQGAKPGEGGQLPGFKVDDVIAKVRNSTPGVSLISPPPHHDIYSIEDIAQLIFDLKNVNPSAEVSVKLVSQVGIGTVAAGVTKAATNRVVVSGTDGGTGASPISSLKHAGVPWELGISEVQQTLVEKRLRSRVKLQVDGQMRTGRDVLIAAMLGAEEFGFSTSALISVGCVMARVCHNNTCPTGVATQDPELRAKFKGKPEDVVTFMTYVARNVRELLAQLGFASLDEVIGQTQYLKSVSDPTRPKTKRLDLKPLLFQPEGCEEHGKKFFRFVNSSLDEQLGNDLIILAKRSIDKKEPVKIRLGINNNNRSTGAMLSGAIARQWGPEGLPDDTITCEFSGSAGQSFGAFLAAGVTFQLYGDANDYVGKGLSGGKIIVAPQRTATFKPEKNVIIGNTAFYGATSGEAYIRGEAGERFCVRNSGCIAVVEGIGDHGCEYMTGGRVIILGEFGRNFAAGMSGGIAYVYDVQNELEQRCNADMVEIIDTLNPEDQSFLRTYLKKHLDYTRSTSANKFLEDWKRTLRKFKKVMPIEYKRYLDSTT